MADADHRLPAAFEAARPEIAEHLGRLEEGKRNTGGKLDQAIDVMAVMILATGDPYGVYEEVRRLLSPARYNHTAPSSAACAPGWTAPDKAGFKAILCREAPLGGPALEFAASHRCWRALPSA
ncbi:hypothetical protein ACFVXC_06365 [Streptomyces sp. NPDC058257]|uniref:hypothetical protein n=1 Tax=Streptomyces sp. NPDC058257 TaxID=3346409 RepID=UPI0036F00036